MESPEKPRCCKTYFTELEKDWDVSKESGDSGEGAILSRGVGQTPAASVRPLNGS